MQEHAEVDEPARQRFRLRERFGEQVLGIPVAGVVVFGSAIERGGLPFEAGRGLRNRTAQAKRQQCRSGSELESGRRKGAQHGCPTEQRVNGPPQQMQHY
jgi:hypothetical protein